MEDHILDFFNEEEEPYKGEIIIIKSFYFETPARLYAARLKGAAIPSFVSPNNTALPFGNGAISLHIRKEDQKMAAHIIHQMDKRNLLIEPSEEESFHDADHSDIIYQKKINNKHKGKTYFFIVFLIICVIVMMILQFVSNNPLGGWR